MPGRHGWLIKDEGQSFFDRHLDIFTLPAVAGPTSCREVRGSYACMPTTPPLHVYMCWDAEDKQWTGSGSARSALLFWLWQLRGLVNVSYFRGPAFRQDHEPVALLSTKARDELPPRVMRFWLRLLTFMFDIVRAPGKNLIRANRLLRPYWLLSKDCGKEKVQNISIASSNSHYLIHPIKT